MALVGETCHVFPPIGAQGLNLSLRDVADLEDCLASVDLTNPRELAPALARYDRHRRADIGFRTLGVDILNRSLIIPHLPVDLMRGAGFLAMTALGPLRRAVIREGVLPHFLLPRLMQGKPPRAERSRAAFCSGEIKAERHANGRRLLVPICSPLLYEMPHRNIWRPCRVPFAPR